MSQLCWHGGVSIEAVLGRYNVKLRRVNQHSIRGTCPLPSHSSDKSKESFIVQTEKNIWACQSTSCVAGRNGKKGGNILDFVSIMSGCSIRDAALKLQEWFVHNATPSSKVEKGSEASNTRRSQEHVNDDMENENAPLPFALKDIDHAHAYLRQRGMKEETAKTFGVGFFSGRGSMTGRIVIPIHNSTGDVVAYAGRSVDSSEPKYKLPAGFKKSAELFNLHRVLALSARDRETVILCEGFFDCMKVHQAGLPAVVSLMGSSVSNVQEKILQKFARVIVFLDGDEAGREAAQEISFRLARKTFVRVVDLPDGKQPDQLSSGELKELLSVF